jgi:phosphatidylglycerophosphatase A
MTAKTDPPSSAGGNAPAAASSKTPPRKPRISIFIATACGLGYLPKAPGTWGSLAGLALAMLPFWGSLAIFLAATKVTGKATFFAYVVHDVDLILCAQIALALLTAAIGVRSAGVTAKFWGLKDPGRVVIDEVSGQHLTLLLGCALPAWQRSSGFGISPQLGLITAHSALNWKYLLLGFILFRVFDIWKPFPARQAESLPGGWGIVADDWVAGIYAGLGLWLARALGL